jgi:hypothetical protein
LKNIIDSSAITRLQAIVCVVIITASIAVAAYGFNLGNIRYGPGPVEIKVTTDKPYYLQGEEVNFTITVNNPQNWPVRYPGFVGTTIENEGLSISSPSVFLDYAMPEPTFPAHSRTLYNPPHLSWNQTMDLNGTAVQVPPGNYTLTVSLSGPGYDESNNCTFEIRQNP